LCRNCVVAAFSHVSEGLALRRDPRGCNARPVQSLTSSLGSGMGPRPDRNAIRLLFCPTSRSRRAESGTQPKASGHGAIRQFPNTVAHSFHNTAKLTPRRAGKLNRKPITAERSSPELNDTFRPAVRSARLKIRAVRPSPCSFATRSLMRKLPMLLG